MTRFYAVLGIMGFLLITAELSSAQAKCPLKMVRVGNLCVDTYEAVYGLGGLIVMGIPEARNSG